MAFLFIERPVKQVRSGLLRDKKILERVLSERKDSASEVALRSICEKIKCVDTYQKIIEKRGGFEKIKHLRVKNPKKYLKECRLLVKDIRGIDMDSKSLLFRVRLVRNGKQTHLGSLDTLNDALEILELYV